MRPIDQLNAALQAADIPASLWSRWQSFTAELASYPSALVAYSGGVDSAFLAYVAHKILAELVKAVTIGSVLEPAQSQKDAFDFAALHGIPHISIDYDPLLDADFQKNTPERCYHCKKNILNLIWEYARENHFAVVLEGQNIDDLSQYRPGRKAVAETGAISPLANNQFTKSEIRQMARLFGLATWDKPSTPCLATRIPYGTQITPESLVKIEQAENYLHQNGFATVRVRCHHDLAKIEVPQAQFQQLLEMHSAVVSYFNQIGFLYVTLDLQGFRSGSMDEGLTR